MFTFKFSIKNKCKAQFIVLLLNHGFDLSSSIIELLFAHIKFKIKEENKGIGHLTHFTHVKWKHSFVKFGIPFVVILIELDCECESTVQYTLPITICEDSCISSDFVSCEE